jgi:ribosomal-protein-alanine N-acetyltransferase
MVAERGDEIVGQMVYQLFPHKLELLTLAVDPQYRHEGVGTALLDKLKFKVQSHRRGKVVLAVREDNLAAQLFFRRCGLRATAIVPDGYRMEWAAPLEFQPFNFATRLTTCEN